VLIRPPTNAPVFEDDDVFDASHQAIDKQTAYTTSNDDNFTNILRIFFPVFTAL
jgi:hypothetical protein